MNEKQVLVVSSSRRVRRHINRSLASIGFDVEHCPMEWEAVAGGLARAPRMCIVDLDGEEQSVRRLLNTLNSSQSETLPLLISQDPEAAVLQEQLVNFNLNNVIAKHGGLRAGEMIDENELMVTCQKLIRRDIFGLEKYLPTWNVKIHSHEIGGTDAKLQALDALDDYLDLLDTNLSIKEAVLMVADELMMNAIFSAPRDEDGNAKYEQVIRTQPVTVEPHERATFKFACDGRNIALSVKDCFGSLDREVIMNYLSSCLTGNSAQMKTRTTGAGLGLHMIFSSITQLTFNIERGVSTEVIALFYARSGPLGFKTSGRSLNIFYTSNGA